jgi:phage terminase large subunit-like protein
VEAGNIHLPNPRPHGQLHPNRQWVEDFLHQCTVFPRGAHDDDVDAFTQLLARWQQPTVRYSIRSLAPDFTGLPYDPHSGR